MVCHWSFRVSRSLRLQRVSEPSSCGWLMGIGMTFGFSENLSIVRCHHVGFFFWFFSELHLQRVCDCNFVPALCAMIRLTEFSLLASASGAVAAKRIIGSAPDSKAGGRNFYKRWATTFVTRCEKKTACVKISRLKRRIVNENLVHSSPTRR